MPAAPSPAPAPQSAALPYRLHEGEVEVLLVTTRGKQRWIVPKGNVEEGLGPRRSAAREAYEEAGVTGPLGRTPLGRYHHGRAKKAPEVEVYLLRVEYEADLWPEQELRRRKWFPIATARARIGVKGLCALLRDAEALLQPLAAADDRAAVDEPGWTPARAAA